MAYDEGLVERVRGVLDERQDVSEKRMFGGIAFMVRGHMCVGVQRQPADGARGLGRPRRARRAAARPPDGLHRPADEGIPVRGTGRDRAGRDLERWVGHALRYVSSLPAKEPVPKRIAAARIHKAASASPRRAHDADESRGLRSGTHPVVVARRFGQRACGAPPHLPARPHRAGAAERAAEASGVRLLRARPDRRRRSGSAASP